MYNWACNYDIQRWVFLKESISLNSISHRWRILLQRCYGNRQEAFNQFQVLLEEIPFSNGNEFSLIDTVSCHIKQIYHLYKYECEYDFDQRYSAVPNSKVSSDYYPVNETIRNIIVKIRHGYENIVPFIIQMINEPYDDLRIYLHYECYFLCVRFLYHTEKDGWVDSTTLMHQHDYYNSLVILHAYASLIQREEHSNHIITLCHTSGVTTIDIVEIEDVWRGIINNDIDISESDKNPFCKSYLEWKNSTIS